MQAGAIDRAEGQARVQRQTARGLSRVDTAAHLASADAALDAVDHQRLAVALEGTADRAQFAAARQDAAQCLKCNLPAPAFQ
jgi:hypothetical protein